MTWPIAIFGIFSILIISVAVLLLVVYLKEYGREQKILAELKLVKEETNKDYKKLYDQLNDQLVFIDFPPESLEAFNKALAKEVKDMKKSKSSRIKEDMGEYADLIKNQKGKKSIN
jgi:signal recognition particle GTPase